MGASSHSNLSPQQSHNKSHKYGPGQLLGGSFLQSNEVKSSNHMEKEGLSRALNFLRAKCLEIDTLITDRHRQIS